MPRGEDGAHLIDEPFVVKGAGRHGIAENIFAQGARGVGGRALLLLVDGFDAGGADGPLAGRDGLEELAGEEPREEAHGDEESGGVDVLGLSVHAGGWHEHGVVLVHEFRIGVFEGMEVSAPGCDPDETVHYFQFPSMTIAWNTLSLRR